MTMQSSTILRKYIDILNEAPAPKAPVPAPKAPVPASKAPAPASKAPAPAPKAPATTTAQGKFKLVLPTAAQLKAEYKDVGEVSNDITSRGSKPEEIQRDLKNYETRIAKLKAEINNLNSQGNTGAAQLKQKTLDRVENEAKALASGDVNMTGGLHDPDSIGTMSTDRPFSKLISNISGSTGAAYKGDGVPKDETPMSGWELIAQAIALPQGQALWLNGDVAFKLMHKLNPWVFKAQPNTPEMAALMQYRQQLPDPQTGGPSKWNTVKEDLSAILKEHIEEVENEGLLTSGDYFCIELAEDEGIETYIIESWDDAVLIAADHATLQILEELGLLSEAGPAVSLPTQKIKVPPVPAMPQPPQGVEGEPRQNGGIGYDLGQGSLLVINPDGTRTYDGSFGSFTYDKTGKAIKYNSPNLGGLAGEVDLTSGGQTTNYNVGDIAMSQKADAAGKITGTDAAYSLAGQTMSMSTDASGKKTTSMTPVPMKEGSISDTFEAEYQGRKVPLGKRMAGDVKKSKVYVRKPNGKVVKVNFGDKNMTIKKHLPGHRKSFRARHNCDNPGPRWKARYWSCRAW